jgi:dCTP diphosphatase
MSDTSSTIADLRAAVARFVAEREWEPYHDAKNLAGSVLIEAAELLEHFQWVRSEELPALLSEPGRREEIADELADVVCYVLALANVLEIDVSDAVLGKLIKNARKYPGRAVSRSLLQAWKIDRACRVASETIHFHISRSLWAEAGVSA